MHLEDGVHITRSATVNPSSRLALLHEILKQPKRLSHETCRRQVFAAANEYNGAP